MIYEITIAGVTPYMQHRMDDIKLEQWEKDRGNIIERRGVNHEDLLRAEYHCFRNSATGKCFIPSEHIRCSLIGAGGFMKAKVGNRSRNLSNIIAAMFMVTPEEIEMPDFDCIDKRSVINRNVKARVICIRPKWTKWKATFKLHIGEDSFTKIQIEDLFKNAGNYIGIGSYRPTNKGYFGRFELADMKKLN
jgi:hypothetical protein